MKEKWQQIKKYVWIILYLAAAIFVIFYLHKYFLSITKAFRPVSVKYIILALISNILAFGCMAYAWGFAINRHYHISYLPLMRSFYSSQLTRYVPGNIWSFLARFNTATGLGVSASAVGYYLAVENVCMLFVAFISALFVITVIDVHTIILVFILGLIACIAIIALALFPDMLKMAIRIVMKRFGYDDSHQILRKKDFFIILLLFFGYWFLFGLSFFFILQSLSIHSVNLIQAIGINATAWLIGYVSFVTPSGLGVREGAFVFLLGKFAVAQIGFLAALLSRFIFTIAEVIGFLVVFALEKLSIRK